MFICVFKLYNWYKIPQYFPEYYSEITDLLNTALLKENNSSHFSHKIYMQLLFDQV